MKLTNLKITPKLGILVGVTLLGLCIAGALAGYLMQREMLNARIDQTRSMVEMVRNLGTSYKKQVDAGQMTKEAAIAEFSKRANAMTYANGAGYIFGTSYDGITMMAISLAWTALTSVLLLPTYRAADLVAGAQGRVAA